MKITRPTKIKQQVELANNIKAELLRLVQLRLKAAQKSDEPTEELQDLKDELEAVSEVFSISKKHLPYAEADRCGSMLSGPFFVSKKFPAPVAKSGALYPIVQFDLAMLSKALQADAGCGLLQLWYDIKGNKELIRVIPADAVVPQDLIDLQVKPLDPDDSFPLPGWLERNPVQNGVEAVQGLVSCGVETHGNLADVYCEVFEGKNDWLRTLLTAFDQITLTPTCGVFSAGGTLQVIDYNHTDVKMRQLLKLSDWGSSGNAEIFFRPRKGKATEYAFWSSVR
jgi:hypothetical protein